MEKFTRRRVRPMICVAALAVLGGPACAQAPLPLQQVRLPPGFEADPGTRRLLVFRELVSSV